MSCEIRDDEYELLRKAVCGCSKDGGTDEVLDRVLSVVEDIIEERERPLRELATELGTGSIELSTLGFKIREGVEQRISHEIFEILNEWESNLEEDSEEVS